MREVPRNTDSTSSWGIGLPPVCKYLLLANGIVFLLQLFITRSPHTDELRQQLGPLEGVPPHIVEQMEADLLFHAPKISVVQEWLQLETEQVVSGGQIWRLITCAFCHDRFDILHIVFNMLFLFWFGVTLEGMYGSREFLFFYLTGAGIASIAHIALALFTGHSHPAIGASGAVMAVTMLYAIHFPREKICIFWFFPMEIRWVVLFYVIYDLHPVLLTLAGEQVFSGIAHAAHLGGLFFGFYYSWSGMRIERILGRFRLRSSKGLGPRPVSPPDKKKPRPDEIGEQVDLILQKIHEHGESSLSESERETLKTASERLKKKKD
jgi:membrane associated rhomboid family serine protease